MTGIVEALQALGKEHIPSNMRLYASTMFGERSPVDESYFPQKDLDAFRTAVANSHLARKQAERDALKTLEGWAATKDKDRELPSSFGKGATVSSMQKKAEADYLAKVNRARAVEYGHYPDETLLNQSEPEMGWGYTLGQSFNSPGFRAATTVGSGNISKDADGNTIITDTYDWNGGEAAKQMSLMDSLKLIGSNLGSPVSMGNIVGNHLAPAGAANARKVRLNLGKLPE